MACAKCLASKFQGLELMAEKCLHLSFSASDLLRALVETKDLSAGRRLHAVMAVTGLDVIPFMTDHLIRMFGSCGSLADAEQMFCTISKPSVYSWNAVISVTATLGDCCRTFGHFNNMKQMKIGADRITFLGIMKACANSGVIEYGRHIHDEIIKCRLETDVIVGSSLLDMYVKCGRLNEARFIFDNMPSHTVVTWGAMIGGYVHHRHDSCALELYKEMQLRSTKPNKLIFSFVLKACISMGALIEGRLVHGKIMQSGTSLDVVIGNSLLDMYAKWGYFEDAVSIFCNLLNRTVVSWCTIILGCIQSGHSDLALEFFKKMQVEGEKSDRVIFLAALKACSSVQNVKEGRLVHDQIMQSGFDSDVAIGSTLIDMYAKCVSLDEATNVFIRMPHRNLVPWSALISGHAENGDDFQALAWLQRILQEDIEPDQIAFLCILKLFSSTKSIQQGRVIHGWLIESGLQSDVYLGNSLVDMYAKCGNLQEACELFEKLVNRTVVSWGAMIEGFIENRQALDAVILFEKMKWEGVETTKIILTHTLTACSNLQLAWQGQYIHSEIIRSGFALDVVVGSSLVDMYASCGRLHEARSVFDNLSHKNIVSWGAMMNGYALHDRATSCLELFVKMLNTDLIPSRVTFLSTLTACSSIGALDQGRLAHDQILRNELLVDVIIGNALVNMYVKCGSLEDARKVFDSLQDRNVISWGTIITGYAWSGNLEMARECFILMQRLGIQLNNVCYASLLTACVHSGQLQEGQWFFNSVKGQCIEPSIEHYSCMADLFGRTGRVEEARDLLQTMPISPDFAMWMSLLTSCGMYGNMKLGQMCLDITLELDPTEASKLRHGLKPHAY